MNGRIGHAQQFGTEIQNRKEYLCPADEEEAHVSIEKQFDGSL